MKKRRPTSFDIAAFAGVSQATVSRALRKGAVSEDVRKRVFAAAKALNYAVDVNVRKLRSSATRTLALLVREDINQSAFVINPFFMPMIGSITKAAAEIGYDLIMALQESSADWTADFGFSRRSDGIICLGYGDYLAQAGRLAQLDAAGTPLVIWGPVLEGERAASIGSDNEQGAYAATQHLIEHGRRNIVFRGEISEHLPEFHARYQGYRRALAAAGLPSRAAPCAGTSISTDDGYAAGVALLSSDQPFDAIFAASDLLAMGAVQAINDRGKSVPRDIAIVGFDDIWAASCCSPKLTSVRQDTARAGELLVDSLIKLIRGEHVAPCRLPTQLIVRQSCGCVPALTSRSAA